MTDFLNISSQLSEDERILQKSVSSFVEKKVFPSMEKHFENSTFPIELVEELGNQGYLGSFLPEGYGGAGGSYVEYGLLCQELEKGDSGIRSFCSVQTSLVMFPIWQFGSEEQKKKWLPLLASGKAIGCFALTEPDFGSNPAGMLTRVVKKGGDYIINGTKRWITNANIADVCLVWAKNEQGEVQGFLVEKGNPGLTQLEMKHKFSLRASHTGELILENCKIPAANKLPNTQGLKSPLKCLDSARYGISWGALGAAISCYEAALSYSKTRIQFEKPIASYQLVQAKLVKMITEISKGQLLALHIGRLRDLGFGQHQHVSMAKMNNVSMALDVARVARDILGANGITTEYPVIRHMLNLESVNTYEGTEDIHRLIVGKSITDISAFF